MICVIGSHAINVHLKAKIGKAYRRPMDLDIVCSEAEAKEFATKILPTINEQYRNKKGDKLITKGAFPQIAYASIMEAELTDVTESAKDLHDLILNDPKTIYKDGLAYASMDVCYLLKMSHRYLKNNSHFIKTMRDIHNLRNFDAQIRPEHEAFYKAREKATYYYKHPKLNQDKMNFFNGDGVAYVYDHDQIHESVKIGDRPAYSYFQSDNAEVMCDMKKFFDLPMQIRLNAVYEESSVLALERSIIPFGTDYQQAFLMALEKVCTSITSGKFREFAWENYAAVRQMFDANTFDRFFEHVQLDMVDMAKKAA